MSRTAWMDVPPLALPALDRDCSADICVIGAGISGLSTAYSLTREGRSVVVLDAGPVGGGMTQRTTAHLTNALDDRYFELERHHGQEGARAAAESHTAAIDRIERTVAEEDIDCDFERLDGYLFAAPDAPPALLTKELAAAHRAGLAGVEEISLQPVGATRDRPVPAISASGPVSSAQILGRHGSRRSPPRRKDLLRHARRIGRGRCVRACHDDDRPYSHRRRGGGRDQHADQRRGHDSHEASAVQHLRRRAAPPASQRPPRTLLGHGQPVSLCKAAPALEQRLRSADRRRRGS